MIGRTTLLPENLELISHQSLPPGFYEGHSLTTGLFGEYIEGYSFNGFKLDRATLADL